MNKGMDLALLVKLLWKDEALSAAFELGIETPERISRQALWRKLLWEAEPASSRHCVRAAVADGRWPRLRFHDLRHTFASHLVIDLRLDVAQVSRILGHAHVTTTLDVYTHLFDEARHSTELRAQLAGSAFADLLGTGGDDAEGGEMITLPQPRLMSGGPLSARERAARRWGQLTAG